DKAQVFQGLTSGDYHVALSDFQHRVTKGGWDGLGIVTEVLDGNFAGRKDFNQFNFDEVSSRGKTIPKNILESRVRIVQKLAYLTGVTLKPTDWNDIDSLVAAFQSQHAIGKDFIMHLTVKENPNNPQYPYKNYDFDKYENSRQHQARLKARQNFLKTMKKMEICPSDHD
ncbi:hypothetical protein Q757_08225, partial [Oenococcus alcoholitolerans]